MANDLIRRADAIDALMAWEEDSIWDEECLKHRGEPYWISPSDVVENLPSAEQDREYIEQIKWERDTAISQLKDLGYGLGEKIRTDGDTISRQAAIDAILDLHDCPNGHSDTYDKACIIGVLEEVPSAVVPIKDKCLTCIHCENCTDEQTFEEFMFGQDMGNPEDGSL